MNNLRQIKRKQRNLH